MPKVDSINNKKTCVRPVGYGLVGGALSGFALKYLYPVTQDEKNAPSYKDRIGRFMEDTKLYTSDTEEFLDAIRQKHSRTKVEDVFVKSFDGMKYGEKISPKVFDRAMNAIKKNGEGDAAEMRNLFRALKQYARECSAKYIGAINALIRFERPTSVFMGTGAIMGAIIAVASYFANYDSKKV